MADETDFVTLPENTSQGPEFRLPSQPEQEPLPVSELTEYPLLLSRIEQYPPSSKRRNVDIFCSHCKRLVSEKTFKKHRSLYPVAHDSLVTESKDQVEFLPVPGLKL